MFNFLLVFCLPISSRKLTSQLQLTVHLYRVDCKGLNNCTSLDLLWVAVAREKATFLKYPVINLSNLLTCFTH